MKRNKSQFEILRSIRKPTTPKSRIIKPKKGGGYSRKGNQSPFSDSMEYHQSFAQST